MKKAAIEKLTNELDKIVSGIELYKGKEPIPQSQVEIMKQQSTILIRHLMKRCLESESLCIDILQEHKNWDRCMKYINDKAYVYAVNQVACILGEQVFEWAEDYFHLDDKEQVAKEEAEKAKKKEEKEKRIAEDKEREAIARKKAISKLSKTEGWDNLSDDEREKKIKEETRNIKYKVKIGTNKNTKQKEKKVESKNNDFGETPFENNNSVETNKNLVPFEKTKTPKSVDNSTKENINEDNQQMDLFSMYSLYEGVYS